MMQACTSKHTSERAAHLEGKQQLYSVGGTCGRIKSYKVHASEEEEITKIHRKRHSRKRPTTGNGRKNSREFLQSYGR